MKFYKVNRIPIKRRARVTRKGYAYVDAQTKADIALVKSAYTGAKYTCPVIVWVYVYKALPKATKKAVERLPFTQKPDVDNVLKAVLDALNGVAYEDDRQVIAAHVIKHERARIPGEYCMFAVEPLGER